MPTQVRLKKAEPRFCLALNDDQLQLVDNLVHGEKLSCDIRLEDINDTDLRKWLRTRRALCNEVLSKIDSMVTVSARA